MPDTPAAPETHEFKAEVAAVLRLVTNSLYTNREIFLRELVSNASDALDKARFEALVRKDLVGQDQAAKITIIADKQRGVLTIEDTGIGMTHDEAVQNLGTIAHSGTLKFLEAAKKQAEGGKSISGLIGQFGVGFYSAFMVADRIEVDSLSALPGSSAISWTSSGDGGFQLGAGTRSGRGTRIELTLKDDAKDFLDRHRIQYIIKRYSNFIMYPIYLVTLDEGGKSEDLGQINEGAAFWAKNPKELDEDDYEGFYRHVMGGFVLPGDKPLARLHLSLDAPIQFNALLYIPCRRPADLFADESKHLQLYARRVLVMDSCDKLLPTYLRFVRGVVDSQDLPLNVSREMLQEHQTLSAIRRQLTRKTLKLLEDTAAQDAERYAKVWKEFGVFIKEGLHTDNAHRKQITELLRFTSTTDANKLISLREYVDAMPADQPAIYYITGSNAQALANSPHLEACRARGYAVLLMTDHVDEWVVQDLQEYAEKPLRSVTQGDLEWNEPAKDDESSTVAEKAEDDAAATLAALLERAKSVLKERVKDVRPSKRLTESASCLVDAEGDLGRNMQRILQLAGREIPERPRILEINPNHSFVQAAQRLATEQPDSAELTTWIELLFDQANLAEGHVVDPIGIVKRIQSVLDKIAMLPRQ